MGAFVELSVLAIRQVVSSAASKVPGGGLVVSTAANALEGHFTNHGRQLSTALARSNERAWRALELSLAGDGLWDRGKGMLAGGDERAFRKQARLFLDTVAVQQLPADPQFRPECLRELRDARKAGILSNEELDPADLSRRVGVFAGLVDAPAVLDAEWRILDRVADQFPAKRYPHLQQLLKLRAGDGPPLLAVAVRYFFRVEVQADDALFRGLSFDTLERVEESQQEGFDALNELLLKHVALLDDLLGLSEHTHAAVLDLRDEQGRQGGQLHEIYDQLIDLKSKLDLPTPRLRPRDTLSIHTDAERQMVRSLLARFRALPPDEQQQAPALLNGLGMLEAAAAQSPDDPGLVSARQIFKEVAAAVPDRLAKAEAHSNDYRAALEQRNWPEALTALRQCVASAPEQFAPFPFDRYEPLAILGAGAFGTAFLCRHPRLKSQLVVKSLNPSELQRDVDELFREAQVLEVLDHPGIIRVRDADYADAAHTRPYLVMDYFDGVDLEEHVKHHGVLPVPIGLEFARQLAEAIAAAHAKGLLHRDLKPSNVLVRIDGVVIRIKLIDFGLALRSSTLRGVNATVASGKTLIGSSIAGSLDYAAPEQMGRLTGVSVGPYSDVYGWAKTCCWAMCKTAQPLPRHFRPLPPALAELLEDCMAEEPKDRPAGFAAVLERLRTQSSGAVPAGSALPTDSPAPQNIVRGADPVKPSKDNDSRGVVLRGTAPDHKTPRELDLKVQGTDLTLHMHPPGKTGAYSMTVKVAEVQRALAAGVYTLAQTGTTRRLDLKFHPDDSAQIPLGEVRIQLGTTSNQWWMYAAEDELRQVLATVGIILVEREESSTRPIQAVPASSSVTQTTVRSADPTEPGASPVGSAPRTNSPTGPTTRDRAPQSPVAAPKVTLAPPVPLPDFTNSLGMKFVRIGPGGFLMGSPPGEADREKDETQHSVKITRPFMMAVHPVTRGQFSAFVKESGYKTDAEKEGWAYAWTDDKWDKVKGASWRNPGFEQDDTHPVTEVSWNDAGAFAQWLGGKDGKPCRLPTEAEWEYACRAGTTTPFHTGETVSTDQANYDGNYAYGAGVKGVYRQKTTPVGSFKPNAWGLFDMHGNVWEWCADAYAEYPAGPATDPAGPTAPPKDASRVLRGGAWNYIPVNCRSACRFSDAPDNRNYSSGFRVVLDSR